jgi:hypothetical protein
MNGIFALCSTENENNRWQHLLIFKKFHYLWTSWRRKPAWLLPALLARPSSNLSGIRQESLYVTIRLACDHSLEHLTLFRSIIE